ncbi:tyrosine-type recombinase/integrase [Brachyspira hyodysenteriae]|uniref:tyrosine-type recombinase/integrase n=1 Tax=Brachyspira hyodysenteriae TaxID=159 RepID=UPI003BF48AC7
MNFTLHSFRRGLATELYNDNNIQVQDIALLLGHSKIDTTVKHYIKADKKRLNTALEKHNLFKITEIEENKCVHFNDIVKMFQERQIQEN